MGIRSLAKRFLLGPVGIVSPNAADAIRAALARRHLARWEASAGITRVNALLAGRYGRTVRAGPFAGMRLPDDKSWGGFGPKLLGTYERELSPAMDAIAATPYDAVVDVGSADGYYAVGLAMRLPSAAVYAFDIDPAARRACAAAAGLNGVAGRVTVRGRCDPKALHATLAPHRRALVVSDCEGYEYDLLDPGLAPSLASADVLVEMHLDTAREAELLSRFAGTHDCRTFDSWPRRGAEWPDAAFLDAGDWDIAVNEYRHGPQRWAFLVARSGAAAAGASAQFSGGGLRA